MMQVALTLVGLAIAGIALAVIFWSIAVPTHRLWPPNRYTALTPMLVWAPTLTIFGVLIVLGIWGWGNIALPDWLRYGIGVPLTLIGNIVVWSGVSQFGFAQTGGAMGSLCRSGIYRYSRNPQYVADIAIIGGWIVLSSACLVVFVGIGAIAVLIAAPFAEEPWLREQYGSKFDAYASRVRRYF